MKRAGVCLIWIVGIVSLGYLALYAYAAFNHRRLEPGEPIQIFRKPDAPSYS